MATELQITFLGGAGTVTGANMLLESLHTRLLVDCGLLQGLPESDTENRKAFPYEPKTIDFVFLTHAHMDHIGKVCKLVRDGFRGTIYSTPETKELSNIMLLDALKVMDMNMKSSAGKETPLYELNDLNQTISQWKTIPYDTQTKVNDEFSVYLKDAGHILGAAMYEFTYNGKKIVFTGDSGNSPSPLLKNTEPITDATYLILDSVYGDKIHEPKDERDARFQQIVSDTIKAGGALVIPAFSVERTQVILYELNKLIEGNKIPSVPVFLDAPLGEKITQIYSKDSQDFNQSVQNEIKSGDNIFDFPKLNITHGVQDSMDIIYTPNPKIIIAGSGMSSGGRIVSHEMHYLPDPKSTILLMGYQAVGTLGRTIQGKPSFVEINGSQVPVRARIEIISGYSSHKDSNALVAMVADTKATVKKVFIIMGEPKSSTYLAQRLHDELEVDAVVPERGTPYPLE